jgi:hypothetical protein
MVSHSGRFIYGEKSCQHQLNRRLNGPGSGSGRSEHEILLHLKRFEPWIIKPAAQSLPSVPGKTNVDWVEHINRSYKLKQQEKKKFLC